jgi:hypothetical protein
MLLLALVNVPLGPASVAPIQRQTSATARAHLLIEAAKSRDSMQ